MEDVGRHNAVDKIAGWMFRNGVTGADKSFYTTGRLTSEMVIKCARMGIPVLVSRSGFTAWGVELAREIGMTLIGRAKGKRFLALAGEERILFDQDLAYVAEESAKSRAREAGNEGRTAWLSCVLRDACAVPVQCRTEHEAMILGVVLAGGLASRMGGGDKGLRSVAA